MQNGNNRTTTKPNKPLVPLVERNDYVLGSESILGRGNSKHNQEAKAREPLGESNLEFSRYLTNSILHGRPDEYRPKPVQIFSLPQQVVRSPKASNERQVDMDTYIREQRKLIHQVSRGKESTDGLSESEVQYEISEFKRESRPKHKPLSKAGRAPGENLNTSGDFKDILKLQSLQKSKRHLQSLLSGLDRSGTAYRTMEASGVGNSYFDGHTGRSPVGSPREFRTLDSGRDRNYKPEEVFHNRSALVSRRAHPAAEFVSEKKPSESIFVFEEEPKVPKAIIAPSKGIVDRRLDRFARKSHNKSMDAMKILANESSKRVKLPNELIIVGEDDQISASLAQLFKKKMKLKEKAQDKSLTRKDDTPSHRHEMFTPEVSATITEPKDYCRNKSSDLSKMDLRKKMLEYGKKIEKPKVKKVEEPTNFQMGLHSVSSAQTLKKGDCKDRRNSPKPDVLERLARGIKPKVEKAEIHEITRRQMEKFEKLKQQGSLASPSKTEQKKAELLERKSKVKQLDKVGSRLIAASSQQVTGKRQLQSRLIC